MKEKYRLFGKIPVVDILIVLVLIVFFGGAVWLLSRDEVQQQTGAQSQGDVHPFTAVLLVENTASENAALVAEGDKLYLKEGGYLGTVTAVRQEPHLNYATDDITGEYVGTVMPGRSDLYITIDGQATENSSKGIYVNTARIAYGNRHSIGSEKYLWTMAIVELETEESK